MKRLLRKSSLASILLLLMINGTVHATSWVALKPEEVIKRAKVIVQGQYDFSKAREGSEFIWVSYDFKVDRVYRGAVTDPLVVGIDGFDVGWVDEFQREKGSFVLFLEQTDNAKFYTPVAGPNGMIQIVNGEVQHSDSHGREVFSDFLRKTKSRSPNSSQPTSNRIPPTGSE